MDVRHAVHPDHIAQFDTEALRANFLVSGLFPADRVQATYTHEDRMVVFGTSPVAGEPVDLPTFDPLRADFFLERREAGIVNLGGPGTVVADGTAFDLDNKDCLYLGAGTRDVRFSSNEPNRARFYGASANAHATHPNTMVRLADTPGDLVGTAAGANVRTVRRYIHDDGLPSCQLVLGITVLEEGSVWNTMPCHLHDRRTEIYLYTDLAPEQRVIHLMGPADRTRNLVVAGDEAVISPSWSVHLGCGTGAYAYVWAMAGENKAFADMDHVAVPELR